MFALFLADLKLSPFQYLEKNPACKDTIKEIDDGPLSRPHSRTMFRTPSGGHSISPLRLWKH